MTLHSREVFCTETPFLGHATCSRGSSAQEATGQRYIPADPLSEHPAQLLLGAACTATGSWGTV